MKKQKAISKGVGWPSRAEGRDGDFTVRRVPGIGKFLLYKDNGIWYSARLSRMRARDEDGHEPLKAPLGIIPKKPGEITLNGGKLNFKTAKNTVQTSGDLLTQDKETIFTTPSFTGNITSTGITNFNITGSDDSAANIYLKGGLNNGAAALYFYPDKGDDAADKFKVYAEDGATTDGLRFAKMSDAGSGGDGSWVDIMKMSYGGNDADDSTINVYSPISSNQNISCSQITAGAPIWQRFRFFVKGANAARYYYMDHDDAYNPDSLWDNYSTALMGDTISIQDERMAVLPKVPEACYFAGAYGTIYNDTGTDNPIIHMHYDTGALSGDEDISEAFASLTSTTVTVNTQDRKYSFTMGAVSGTTLAAGTMYTPTVKGLTNNVWGSITLKFVTV